MAHQQQKNLLVSVSYGALMLNFIQSSLVELMKYWSTRMEQPNFTTNTSDVHLGVMFVDSV